MDKITTEQRDAIKKASSERLRVKLIVAGSDEESVLQLDRPKLMEACAELLLNPAAAEESRMSTLKLKELELRQEEIALRKMEIENRKLEWDKEFRLKEDEFKWQRDNDAERRKN